MERALSRSRDFTEAADEVAERATAHCQVLQAHLQALVNRHTSTDAA
jgi:hypothetical protein